jgi:endo-1,4-beta-xylanase
MTPHPFSTSTPIARRHFLHGISASALLISAPRSQAQTSPLPTLRNLAGGKPLIGTAVSTDFEKIFTAEESAILATQFDSLTPENCMKWQNLCPKEGEYRFEPIDQIMEFAAKNRQSVVGHTLIFNRDKHYPDWLFRDGGKEADAKLVWKRIEDHVTKLMSRYAGRIDS